MKELKLNEYVETGEYEIMAERSQGSMQFENYTIRLYDTGREKDRYILEIIEADRYQYSYDDEDVSNPQATVDEEVIMWINNNTDNPVDRLIARYDWGLIDHFDEVTEDYAGDCVIIWIGNCYGYTPIGYVANEDDNNPQVFPSAKEAQAFVDRENKNSYRLSHNEAGRPSYHIIAYPKG
jgi:hypothetical protein